MMAAKQAAADRLAWTCHRLWRDPAVKRWMEGCSMTTEVFTLGGNEGTTVSADELQ